MKSRLLIGAAAAALAFSFACASAQNAVPGPAAPQGPIQGPQAHVPPLHLPFPLIPPGNHYVCYPARMEGTFKPINVQLHDQFGQGTATVTGITRLCNPVEKTDTEKKVHPIIDQKLHLTCYSITYTIKPQSVVTTNDQFGPERLTLRPATELCLPAGKKL